MKHLAKNDNLQRYREKQSKVNEELVKRAIEHIQKLGGNVSFSLVSKVTYDIANATKMEKGITLAGLSKSKIYRPMIERAKLQNGFNTAKATSTAKNKLSLGDMQMSFHSLRVEVAKLKRENKILNDTLAKIQLENRTIENVDIDVLEQYDEMKQVCISITNRLLELELAYIDSEAFSLNVCAYNDVLVPSKSLQIYFKEKLDDFNN